MKLLITTSMILLFQSIALAEYPMYRYDLRYFWKLSFYNGEQYQLHLRNGNTGGRQVFFNDSSPHCSCKRILQACGIVMDERLD